METSQYDHVYVRPSLGSLPTVAYYVTIQGDGAELTVVVDRLNLGQATVPHLMHLGLHPEMLSAMLHLQFYRDTAAICLHARQRIAIGQSTAQHN